MPKSEKRVRSDAMPESVESTTWSSWTASTSCGAGERRKRLISRDQADRSSTVPMLWNDTAYAVVICGASLRRAKLRDTGVCRREAVAYPGIEPFHVSRLRVQLIEGTGRHRHLFQHLPESRNVACRVLWLNAPSSRLRCCRGTHGCLHVRIPPTD